MQDRGRPAPRTWQYSRYTLRRLQRSPRALQSRPALARANAQFEPASPRAIADPTRLFLGAPKSAENPWTAPRTRPPDSSTPRRSSNASHRPPTGPRTSPVADLAADPTLRSRSLPDSVTVGAVNASAPALLKQPGAWHQEVMLPVRGADYPRPSPTQRPFVPQPEEAEHG
jgi:hypothetical protein